MLIKSCNQNETKQDISKLDSEKISHELWRKVTIEVKSKSGEPKLIEKLKNLTGEKPIEKFKNLFTVDVKEFAGRVNHASYQFSRVFT